jgi:hypothetical protein
LYIRVQGKSILRKRAWKGCWRKDTTRRKKLWRRIILREKEDLEKGCWRKRALKRTLGE